MNAAPTCAVCGKRLHPNARYGVCYAHRKKRYKEPCSGCGAPLHFATQGTRCRRCLAKHKGIHGAGPASVHWTGGLHPEGAGRYMRVWVAPRVRQREHRVVAAQLLGRPLRKGEVVHHVDRNKRNNAGSNLEVYVNAAAHTRHHHNGDISGRVWPPQESR